jgi:hypothetical protein
MRRQRTQHTAVHSLDTPPGYPRDFPRARAPIQARRFLCRTRAGSNPASLRETPGRRRHDRAVTRPDRARVLDAFIHEPGSDAVGDAPLDRAVVQIVGDELRPWRAADGIAVARIPPGRKRSAVARRGPLIAVRILRKPNLRRGCPPALRLSAASTDTTRARRARRSRSSPVETAASGYCPYARRLGIPPE